MAKLWKQMIADSAGESIIVVGSMQQLGSLLVSSGNRGHLSLIAPLRHYSPSLRHVSYTTPQLLVSTGVQCSSPQ